MGHGYEAPDDCRDGAQQHIMKEEEPVGENNLEPTPHSAAPECVKQPLPVTKPDFFTSGGYGGGASSLHLWQVVWCFEHCFKEESREHREALDAACREAGSVMVLCKKALKFLAWLDDGPRHPYVLLASWRELKPCMQAFSELGSPPALIVVCCESARSFEHATMWFRRLAQEDCCPRVHLTRDWPVAMHRAVEEGPLLHHAQTQSNLLMQHYFGMFSLGPIHFEAQDDMPALAAPHDSPPSHEPGTHDQAPPTETQEPQRLLALQTFGNHTLLAPAQLPNLDKDTPVALKWLHTGSACPDAADIYGKDALSPAFVRWHSEQAHESHTMEEMRFHQLV